MTPKVCACFCGSVFAWALVFSGCSSQETYDKRHYVLSAIREAERAKTQTDFILEVRRFTIDSAYSGSGLVYRIGESEYESDFYNAFLASPSAMIAEETRTWLSESRLFARVLDPGSQIDPTHVIEGNITALYGDLRDGSSPKAIIEMRVFLLEAEAGEEPIPIFGKTYKSSIGIDSEGPEGLVEALGRCLQGILSTLESDLAERLS
jgi:cholesterol transport system auxiliary component